jgi:hypothetical protein
VNGRQQVAVEADGAKHGAVSLQGRNQHRIQRQGVRFEGLDNGSRRTFPKFAALGVEGSHRQAGFDDSPMAIAGRGQAGVMHHAGHQHPKPGAGVVSIGLRHLQPIVGQQPNDATRVHGSSQLAAGDLQHGLDIPAGVGQGLEDGGQGQAALGFPFVPLSLLLGGGDLREYGHGAGQPAAIIQERRGRGADPYLPAAAGGQLVFVILHLLAFECAGEGRVIEGQAHLAHGCPDFGAAQRHTLVHPGQTVGAEDFAPGAVHERQAGLGIHGDHAAWHLVDDGLQPGGHLFGALPAVSVVDNAGGKGRQRLNQACVLGAG